MSQISDTPHKNLFFYILVLFNLLFLAYILTIGYYNRLAWDDYAFVGHMRDHGFFSPITYWYTYWQGRFGPQFFINTVLLVYKIIPNLFFFTLLLAVAFIYAIYEILKFYLPLSKFYLLNYSIFLFSALLLTTFEFNTFYLLNVSTMYFGGVLFALIGIVFLLKRSQSILHYLLTAFCFLYVGSSSEHAGMLASFILALLLIIRLHRSDYDYKNFLSLSNNRKVLVAFSSCFLAFIIMILAPGNKIRMTAFQQITDPMQIMMITYNSTKFILYHIFYKLPYLVLFIPSLLFIGAYLKGRIQLKRINILYLVLVWTIGLWTLIFISNLPVAYAMGSVGPSRSYVFISFFVVSSLFLLCLYIGYHHVSRLKITDSLAAISVTILFAFVSYSFISELPLIKKYSQTDKDRISLLNIYKDQKRTEPANLQPLYNPKYVTITDMFRILTNTYRLPADMTDMPVFIGDIGQVSDWRNNHLKFGLGVDFQILLARYEELSKTEIDSIKRHAKTSYETSKFRFYILDNFIYYQIHPPSFEKLRTYIYCRIEPVHEVVLKNKEDRIFFYDFKVSDYQVKYIGDPGEYANFIFIKKEITKFPIKKIETGFFDLVNGTAEFSEGMGISLVPANDSDTQ